MEKRLGHWNGDMPRYLVWNEKARRTRGSLKKRRSSPSTVVNGCSLGSAASMAREARERLVWKACSSTGSNSFSLARPWAKKRSTWRASRGAILAISAVSFSTSGVASSSPSPSKTSRYCGSSRFNSTWSSSRSPQVAKICANTLGYRKKVGPRSKRYPSGVAKVWVRPPTIPSRSNSVTFTPSAASSRADASPPGPAPTTATLDRPER